MMNASARAKLSSFAPLAIAGGFILVSALVWWPRADAAQSPQGGELRELSLRLSSGSDRLAGLVPPTDERPLFHASRRPVAAPEAAKPVEPVLSLLGVIKEENGETVAFVKVSTSGALYRIGKGATVGRWRIIDIGTEEITVSKEGKAPYQLRIGG